MVTCAVLTAISAVLAGSEVHFVDPTVGSVVGRADLGAQGLALFAAPDGRVVVPLAGIDATAVVGRQGAPQRWPGRVFPLFFDEFDRMHVVVPGAVATLNYPERLALSRVAVAGLAGARRAAVSEDGRVVAVIPESRSEPALYTVIAGPSGGAGRVDLPAPARSVVVSPGGDWLAVGLDDGRLALVAPGMTHPVATLALGRSVLAMAYSVGLRHLLVAVATEGAADLVSVRVDPKSKVGLREARRRGLSVEPLAVGSEGKDVLVLCSRGLLVLKYLGPEVRFEIDIPGASDLATLPARPRSALPAWSE